MITLEMISTRELIGRAQYKAENDIKFMYIYELLTRNNIRNYQMLLDFLDANSLFSDEYGVVTYLRNQIEKVKKKIDKENSKDNELGVFTFDSYKKYGLDEKTIIETDSKNMCDVLIYRNPLYELPPKFILLNGCSIERAKDLLGYLTEIKFESEFANNYVGFGESFTKKIYDVIKLYEEQVLRQASETDKRGINLFVLNKDDKRELVIEQYDEIIRYLVDVAEELCICKLTDHHKRKLLMTITASKEERVIRLRQEMINIFTNYMTLTELKSGVVRTKVLNRFIIR